MHVAIPVFCVIPEVNYNIDTQKVKQMINEDDLFDSLYNRFYIDYFTFCDIDFKAFKGGNWISEKLLKYYLQDDIFEFTDENIFEERTNMLKQIRHTVNDTLSKSEINGYLWSHVLFELSRPGRLTVPGIVVVDEVGNIIFSGEISRLTFEKKITLKYIDAIDYHI